MKYVTIALVITASLLFGCSERPATAQELENFIDDPDNGLFQSRNEDGVLVEVKFQPGSLLATRELQQRESTADQYDSVCAKYENQSSFLLTFSRNNEELIAQNAPFTSYSQLIQVLSFKMNQYVTLTTSMGDTLRPAMCLFDRTYRLDNKSRVLVVFPKKEEGTNLFLTIKEFGLNCGDMRFRFDGNAIKQISDNNL